MAYVSIPPTVAKARDETRVQRARLQQWQNNLAKYQKLCPQLSGPIAELQQLIINLQTRNKLQEELITQRIQLQIALDHSSFLQNRTTSTNASTEIPEILVIPEIDNKTPATQTRLHIRPQARVLPTSIRHSFVPSELHDQHLSFIKNCIPSTNAPTAIPAILLIPEIENKTPPPTTKTSLHIRPQTRALQTSTQHSSAPSEPHDPIGLNGCPRTYGNVSFHAIHSSQKSGSFPSSTRLSANNNLHATYKEVNNAYGNQANAIPERVNRKRSRNSFQDSVAWRPVPPHLQAYPSVFEQLIKSSQQPKITPRERNNRFAVLFIEYYNDIPRMDGTEQQPMGIQTAPEQRMQEAEMSDKTIDAPAQSAQEQPNLTSKLTMDMLRNFIPAPALDPALIALAPTTYATAVRVAPQVFEKVRFEVNVGRFQKDATRMERLLSLFEVAKLYNKNVCLCPTGPEPNPVLYTPNDIKRARIYHYFQDKPGAQKGKYANRLYGYIVFGVTGDVDDFVMAMKEWATSNRHELTKHGVPSNSVVAGFIVHASLTSNRDDLMSAIRNTSEWRAAGCPEFSLKVSPLWSSGGADAKVPAICCECERSKVADFEKMCETLFFGENLSLPSAIREAYFFPSRKFAANDPARLTYIGGHRDFLTTEKSVTCGGLGNVYQEVRLRRDSQYSSTIEDLILLVQGTNGPLFRSMDRTIDGKVFLKMDASNVGAWTVRKDQLGDHLRSLVHPDDHALVFSDENQELLFSEPWAKYKDGQLTKNVMQLPNKESLAYVDRYKAKFATPETKLPPLMKKRIHSNVSSDGTSTTANTLSSAETSLGQANVVDLTMNNRESVSSPSHKVHVVEQRVFQETTSPVSSMAGSLSSTPGVMSPKTARMHHLESKVASHDKKLNDIQTSVFSLDEKIVTQGEQSSFQFNRFEELLGQIHGTIVNSMQRLSEPNHQQTELATMDGIEVAGHEDGAYNPIQHSHDWNEEWRRYQAHKSHIDSKRAEWAERLNKEAASKGEEYDYYAAACERYPSPPPVQFPDDITYADDL